MEIVTPHVGVWIETLSVGSITGVTAVTPHVGVWIETETLLAKNITGLPKSHLM